MEEVNRQQRAAEMAAEAERMKLENERQVQMKGLDVGATYRAGKVVMFSTAIGVNDKPIFEGSKFQILRRIDEYEIPWYEVEFVGQRFWLEVTKTNKVKDFVRLN